MTDKIISGVYDNEGQSLDRYCIFYRGYGEKESKDYYTFSKNCNSVQGVCMGGEGFEGPHCGRQIDFEDLPVSCANHLKKIFAESGIRLMFYDRVSGKLTPL